MDPRSKFYTEDGNVCAPRFESVLGWVSKSWLLLSEEQIIKSFPQCGIGSTTTGSYHNYLKEMLENGICLDIKLNKFNNKSNQNIIFSGNRQY